MAQKAQKLLAARNAAILNRTHLISAAVHILFLLLRFFISNRSLLAWILISAPSLAVQFWFERVGRPTYTSSETSSGSRSNGAESNRQLLRAGEDLEAKGLTEWMWDLVYWTWAVVVIAGVFGNWAWWLYSVAPMYSLWLAWSTFSGARASLMGLGGGSGGSSTTNTSSGQQSKRQAKIEKKGGQRVQYR